MKHAWRIGLLVLSSLCLTVAAHAGVPGFSRGVNLALLLTDTNCEIDTSDTPASEILPDELPDPTSDKPMPRIEKLKAQGYEFVRVPVEFHYLYDPAALPANRLRVDRLQRVVNYINSVNKRNLNAIFDLHLARFACGAEYDGIYSQYIEPGNPPAPAKPPYRRTAVDDVFTRRGKFLDFWTAVATYLRDNTNPNQVLIEPLNEPVFLGNPKDWLLFQDDLVNVIRSHAPQHKVIATGSYWSHIDALVGTRTVERDAGPFPELAPYRSPNGRLDDKLVYNVHFYEPMVFTHQGAEWEPFYKPLRGLPYPPTAANMAPFLNNPVYSAELRAELKTYLNDFTLTPGTNRIIQQVNKVGAWAKRNGVPSTQLISTEFGTYPAYAPQRDFMRYTSTVRGQLENNGLGWAMYYAQDYPGEGWTGDRNTDDSFFWLAFRHDLHCALGLSRDLDCFTLPKGLTVPAPAHKR